MHCQGPRVFKVSLLLSSAVPSYHMPLCPMISQACQHSLLQSEALIFIDHLIYLFLTSLAPSGAMCPSVEVVMTGLLLR